MYRISLLVFTHSSPVNLQSEQWHSILITPDLKGSVNLVAPKSAAASPQDFQLISKSDKQLRGIGRLLVRQHSHILLDVAWLQSNKQAGRWVHIYGGVAYDDKGNIIQTIKPMLHAFNTQQTPAYWQLNGLIKINFGRFITVNSRLYLTLPISQVSGVSNDQFGVQYGLVPLQSFSIVQSQRALLNHFLYFDHPLYGALVYIQPYNNKPS